MRERGGSCVKDARRTQAAPSSPPRAHHSLEPRQLIPCTHSQLALCALSHSRLWPFCGLKPCGWEEGTAVRVERTLWTVVQPTTAQSTIPDQSVDASVRSNSVCTAHHASGARQHLSLMSVGRAGSLLSPLSPPPSLSSNLPIVPPSSVHIHMHSSDLSA